MPAGRCAGCGFTESCARVKVHVLYCPQYLALFRNTPNQCLDPAQEYQRHREREGTREARALRRAARMHERFVEREAAASRTDRWKARDILAD